MRRPTPVIAAIVPVLLGTAALAEPCALNPSHRPEGQGWRRVEMTSTNKIYWFRLLPREDDQGNYLWTSDFLLTMPRSHPYAHMRVRCQVNPETTAHDQLLLRVAQHPDGPYLANPHASWESRQAGDPLLEAGIDACKEGIDFTVNGDFSITSAAGRFIHQADRCEPLWLQRTPIPMEDETEQGATTVSP